MAGLSCVIITLNEAAVIQRCISSVQGLADEVLVVDSGSSDETVTICESLGARVIHQPWLGYAAQKNKANSLASFDWILSLDADEALSPELYQSIQLRKKSGFTGVYKMKRLSTYFGRPLRRGHVYPDTQRRLFNRLEVRWKLARVHETPDVPSGIQQHWLAGDLWHVGATSEADYQQTLERYATLWAEARAEQGRIIAGWEPWIKPLVNFVQGYIFRLGFLEGRPGWIVAKQLARYTRLKYQQAYQLTHRK